MNKTQTLSAVRPVGRALAVESTLGIGPGCLRGTLAGVGEVEIAPRRTGRVMVLKTRRLFPSGGFNPTQSLQHREVHHKTVESTALSLVGHEVKISLGQLLYVFWIDTALLAYGHFFFCSCRAVKRSSPYYCHLVVIKDIGLARTSFGVD